MKDEKEFYVIQGQNIVKLLSAIIYKMNNILNKLVTMGKGLENRTCCLLLAELHKVLQEQVSLEKNWPFCSRNEKEKSPEIWGIEDLENRASLNCNY